MDIVFEFLMDLVFEGTLHISTERRVPAWVRYPLIVLIGLVFAAGVVFILMAGVLVLKENVVLGVVFLLLGAALGFFIIRKFRRVYIVKRETWD